MGATSEIRSDLGGHSPNRNFTDKKETGVNIELISDNFSVQTIVEILLN